MTQTVEGKVHKKCGTTERYASTGECVFCKRQNQPIWNKTHASYNEYQKGSKNAKYASDANWRKSRNFQTVLVSDIKNGRIRNYAEFGINYNTWECKVQLMKTAPKGFDWKNDFTNTVGENHYELDHIIPIASGKPFEEIWKLSNLRMKKVRENIQDWREQLIDALEEDLERLYNEQNEKEEK